MTRKTIRHQAATYLTEQDITGIGTVYASPPKIARSSDRLEGAPPGVKSGGVLFVEVLHTADIRRAFGGPTSGKRQITHTMRLHLLFLSRQPKAEDAMDDHDDALQGIVEAVYADRSLGDAAVVFQAGEGDEGIVLEVGMPKVDGAGSVQIWSAATLAVVEWVNA